MHWANYVGSVTADTTGTVAAFAQPVQGNAYNSRDGDEIQYSSIIGRVIMTAGDVTNLVRFIIFQWHPDDNADAPSVGKLLQNSASPQSSYVVNKAHRAKFTVLWDRLAAVATAAGTPQRSYTVHIPMRRLRKTTFNAGSITGRNNLYTLRISDSGAVPMPGIDVDLIYCWRDI